ncbi:MAG: hypothetical protein Q9220_006212 [cf. Caloplaca sp. 1 TL-2023]
MAANWKNLGNGILEVIGAISTTIGDILPGYYYILGSSHNNLKTLCTQIRLTASLTVSSEGNKTYPSGGSFSEAFCRTIHCNQFADNQTPSTVGVPEFQEDFDELLELIKQPEDDMDSFNVEELLKRSHSRENGSPLAHYESRLYGRNFFATSEGYIGLAPSAARPTDQVSILLGCSASIVLRRVRKEYFKVVGSCYLHGFSQGEGLLGPLSGGWSPVFRDGRFNFINCSTGEWSLTDPRLGEMPSGWQVISEDERTPKFVSSENGLLMYRDPRQTLEMFRARGVCLRTIRLR